MIDVATAARVLREEAGDALTVLTMSAMACWPDARPEDFKLLGTMGAAASVGLGLALGRPQDEVWVVDGDGSLLMQLAVAPAVGEAAPPNLVHVVIDNGVYAVSGAQPTPGGVDWPALLVAAGYADAQVAEDAEQLRAAMRAGVPGPRAVVVRCSPERPAYPAGAFAFDSRAEAARMRAVLTRRG